MKHRGAVLTLAAALLVAEGAAALSCQPPAQWLRWSYPDATTEVVPPNAVFRAFAYTQRLVSFELDGVTLPSTADKLRSPLPVPVEEEPSWNQVFERFFERESDSFGTSEFMPPEPLTVGEHDVVIRVWELREYPLPPVVQETYHFQFRVEAMPEPTPEPSIASVTSYDWDRRFARPKDESFPPESSDTCTGVINIARPYCSEFGEDTLPILVELEAPATSGAIGHFVGAALAPLGCNTVYVRRGGGNPGARSGGSNVDSSIQVEAVLPSGLGAPHTFEGEIGVVHLVGKPPDLDYAETPAWGCAMSGRGDNRHTVGAISTLLALGVMLSARRRAQPHAID